MEKISVRTNARTETLDITATVQQLVENINLESGVITVFVPHTTAGITINEGADPDVKRDMLYEINKIIPFEDNYHHMEGNSAAHIKTTLFGNSAQIIVENRKLQLGTWQSIYFCEFDGPRTRSIWIKTS